jgi:hypothetical protein
MRNEEIMQRAIGVLTLMHGGDGEADDLRLALKLLQEDVFSYSVAVPDGAGDDTAEFVRVALEQVMARVAAFTAGLTLGFQAVAHAFEEQCPEADVPAVLQSLALRLEAQQK